MIEKLQCTLLGRAQILKILLHTYNTIQFLVVLYKYLYLSSYAYIFHIFIFIFSTITKPRISAQSLTEKRDSVIIPQKTKEFFYQTFEEFVKRAQLLKLGNDWNIKMAQKFVHIFKNDGVHDISHTDIYVLNDLSFTVRIFAWCIPKEHSIYSYYEKSMKNITLSNLIKYITTFNICSGVTNDNAKSGSTLHSVPKIFNPMEDPAVHQTTFYRVNSCLILSKSSICENCSKFQKNREKMFNRKEKVLNTPAKLQAPLTQTSSQRLKLTIQSIRIENKELKEQIKNLQAEIATNSLTVDNKLSEDLVSIMSDTDQSKVSPFMKFFWEEQQKYLKSSSTTVRYHPMIIRYCLALVSKSAAVYDDIRYDQKKGTGFLVLPSRRRLRDYKNYIKPTRGFNDKIIAELLQKVKDFSDAEKFFVLLMDEMKIQENLVWDKHSGDLIGYVDLGDVDLNYATLQKTDAIASHILVFLIRSIVNPFKFSLANFSTKGATSFQMFPLVWKAISICEANDIKILALTCDGASPNRALFRMHFTMTNDDEMNPDVDVTYRTPNFCCKSEKRFLYFISDVPHLIKTSRNCLANSGFGRCTRYMYNNGAFIIWNHIADFFYEDRNCGLHVLPPKITVEHIKLTPYSIMNVKLAAQVLSSSVSKVLRQHVPGAEGTAEFCSMMDTFFDIMNIRHPDAHKFQLKPALKPFTSVDDPRFSWLRNVFLQYFENWLQSIEDRPGNFTQNAKQRMFISWQTYEGIKITVHSIIEATQFLLQHGVHYVLTERFCQDPLENYFGHQRGCGARKDNPTLRDVGYNDNTIRNQKVYRPIAGNVQGNAAVEISDEPVPCRKKPRK